MPFERHHPRALYIAPSAKLIFPKINLLLRGMIPEMYREVAARVIGDVIMSPSPGRALKKWRELFNVTQADLAAKMNISPSVVSDYESGRRLPGTRFLKKYVTALIELDELRGGYVLRNLSYLLAGTDKLREAVLDMREFQEPMAAEEFCRRINAALIVGTGRELVFGYTVVDSLKLVTEVPAQDYVKLYGMTTQRAAIFTGVTTGRSPMVAVKAMQAGLGGLKPALVVLHGVEEPDELGVLVAKSENIPLAVCRLKTVKELLSSLRAI